MTASIRSIQHADGQTRPYAAATVHRGVVYPCGQVPVRPDGVVPSDFGEQVTVCLDNLERVLRSAGSDLDHILQLTVYLADLADFDAYNTAYLARLRGRPLAPRTTVQVAGFRGDKRIEIGAIAAVVSDDQGR